MTAINIGHNMQTGDSSINGRVIQLPIEDPLGRILEPGQSVWDVEVSLLSLIVPVFWPILVVNDRGTMRKYVFGIKRLQTTKH